MLKLKAPSKKWLGDSMAEKAVETRCLHLEEYLRGMLQLPGIFDVEEVVVFLNTSLDKQDKPAIAMPRTNTSSSSVRTPRVHDGQDGDNHDDSPSDNKDTLINTYDNGMKSSLEQPDFNEAAAKWNLAKSLWRLSCQVTAAAPSPNAGVEDYAALAESYRATRQPQLPNKMPSMDTALYSAFAGAFPTSMFGQKKALVLWPFITDNSHQLMMLENDVVTILEKTTAEWHFGTINGVDFGFFPASYVLPME